MSPALATSCEPNLLVRLEMSSKSFLALAAVTLVAVVLAIVTTSMSDVGNAIAERGKPRACISPAPLETRQRR